MNILKKINFNKKFKKVFSNVSYLFFDKFFKMIIGLTVGAWYARYLGPEKYGNINYLLAISGLFTFLVTLGMDSIIVKELTSENKTNKDILGTGFLLRVSGSFISIIIVNLIGFYLGLNIQKRLFLFIISWILFFKSFNIIDLYFRSIISSKYVVLSNILSLIIISILKILGILNQHNLLYFVWIVLIQNVFIALFQIVFYFRNNKTNFFFAFKKKEARYLLKNSWPLMISSMAVIIYMKVDKTMLGALSNDTEVGLYSIAVKLSELPYFVSTYIMISVYPILVKLYQNNKNKYLKNKYFMYRLMTIVAFSIIMIISPLSEYIVTTIYGKDYLFSAKIMNYHLISMFWVFNGVVQSKKNIILGYQKVNMYMTILGAIVNLILNYYLIPFYGARGAAIATVISHIASVNIVTLILKKTRKDSLYILKNILLFLLIYILIKTFFIPEKFPFISIIYVILILIIWLYKEKEYIYKIIFDKF